MCGPAKTASNCKRVTYTIKLPNLRTLKMEIAKIQTNQLFRFDLSGSWLNLGLGVIFLF